MLVFCLLKVSSLFVCLLKQYTETTEFPLFLDLLPLIFWSGKIFMLSHPSLFQINYVRFLGDMISCRDNSQIPPKRTTDYGVKLPQFHTSEIAKKKPSPLKSWGDLVSPKTGMRQTKSLGCNSWRFFTKKCCVGLSFLPLTPLRLERSTASPDAARSAVDFVFPGISCSSWTPLRRDRPVLEVAQGWKNDIQSPWCWIRKGSRSVSALSGQKQRAYCQPCCRFWTGQLQSQMGLFQGSKNTPT